jgi:alanine racemase
METLAASPDRAAAVVDLDAVAGNVAALRQHVGGRDLMAVVKADGYGHGIVESARAARLGGATWLGVALLDEALVLRAAGDTGPVLSWLAVPGERYAAGIEAGVELSVYGVEQLAEIVAAAEGAGQRARVQLKVDSGLGRGGASLDDWPALVEAARSAQRAGRVEVTGVWSHLACSDQPDHPSVAAQTKAFGEAVDDATSAGLEPRHQHLANSGAVLALPDTWGTLVRPGISVYGISPFADGRSPVDLRPAMTLVARLAMVKHLPAGHGVSYGHTYVTERPTRVGLVPLGYGDGIPRHASNAAAVWVGGDNRPVLGRVCMDQLVVDLGDAPVERGDRVVVFGPGDEGEPTAHEWAEAAGTIGYEVVSRIGPRVPRTYVGGAA